VTVWQFSSEFADKQRDRVERLSAWRSYGEIVDAVITTSVVVPRSVIWKQRDKVPTEAHRIEFKVDADRDAVDALFNSEHGQRAQFAAAIEDGEEANRKIVDALVAKHLSAVAGSDEDRLRSLHASRAKVWVVQKRDPRLHPAITGKGPMPPSIDIRYRPWLDQIDDVVETSHGARWLARGGVLAFHADGCLGFKGAWILDGQHWHDPDKNARSDQLHRYGFS
jgi:hypothetical protein